MSWRRCLVLAVSVMCLSASLAIAQGKDVPVALEKATIEGGASAPIKTEPAKVTYQGKEYSGLQVTFNYKKAYNALIIPIEVNGEKFNTLQFKMRLVSGADTKIKSPQVWVFDKSSAPASTTFLRNAKELGDGWYQFSWDMVYAPDNGAGIDYANLSRIWLRYPFGSIAQEQPDVVQIADMKFVSGLRAQTGDPGLYDEWLKFIANYKPDYSDSSRYLLPPQTGRIANSIPFIKDGKALGQIVVSQNASAPLALAAKELHHWLRQITGADVPRVEVLPGAQPADSTAPRVLLGRQFAEGKFDTDLKWLSDTSGGKGSDGFTVRTDKNNIYIFGATDKGTLNGVFAFLENNTDIIWPRGIIEQSVVFTPRSSLDIVWGDAREKPATELRGWSPPGSDGMLAWQTRSRINYVAPEGTTVKEQAEILQEQGNYVEFGGGHNISYFLGKNPEFYPVIDGQRVTEFNIWKHQPNFTAPGITDAVAQNMIQYIKDRTPEGIDCVNINIEDNWGLSNDPKSLEPIKLPDGTTITKDDPAFRSTQFFIFLNDVVKKVNTVYPKMEIGTYAYFFTATVPKVPLDPHIRILFAPYPRKDYRSPLFSPINDHWWKQMVGWTNKTPNLVMREYYGIFNGFRPLAEVVGAELKSYRARGITRYTAEMFGDGLVIFHGDLRGGRKEWDFMAMEYWIINRLYWNPDQDIEQLRKYFIRRTYQEAAPQMEKFFGTIRAAWFKDRKPSGYNSGSGLMKTLVIGNGLEEPLRQELEAARKTVKNPTSRLMIDTLRLTFEEWVDAAKTKPGKKTEKPAYKFSPEVALRYGWVPVTDRVYSWARATYIDKGGQTIPAIRFNCQVDRAAGKDFTFNNIFDPGLLLMKSGDTLHFTVSPEDAAQLSAPLQIKLLAVDKNNARLQMPEGAVEKRPDGSLRVQWQLQSTDKFDVSQIKQLALTVPHSVGAGQSRVVFHLTDVGVRRGE